MDAIVAKFGGSSLADAGQMRKAAQIVLSDARRRYVVVSAPGKRSSDDEKVTDMLYECCEKALSGEDFRPTLSRVRTRFLELIQELNVDFDLDVELELIEQRLAAAPERDYVVSRGEYLNARIFAAFLGYGFLDAAQAVCFSSEGWLDTELTDLKLRQSLDGMENAVIPGFYGSLPDGTTHTFSRGGSDVTGALAARAVRAAIYENWTDVSGMLAADPRIVDSPRRIDYITYRELRELAYMGASVMHEDAVFPVRKAGIPINIRNTDRPGDRGTMIVSELPAIAKRRMVTGIAGRKGFSSLLVEKAMMNGEVGFGTRLMEIFSSYQVPFEHCPTGIDTMSVVVNTEQFSRVQEDIISDIENRLHPDALVVEDGLAMIAVVGQGMEYSRGIAARIFMAVAEAGVNIRMIDQGSSELNIIIGVDDEDYVTALRAIYAAVG